MKLFFSIIIFSILCSGLISAQGENNWWCISQEMALDFNKQPPAVSTSALSGNPESVATISDKNGRLLLYSDGVELFDADHQLVSGIGLRGHHDAAQGVVFVRVIGQEDLIYLFTLGSVDFYSPIVDNNVLNPLNVSTVKLGDNQNPTRVIERNELLGEGYTELMTVAKGNCGTLWLITHLHSTDEFHAYHITASGIDPVPVISHVGRPFVDEMWRGSIIMNKDHTRFLRSGGPSVEVFDFDGETGLISNAVLVDNLEKYSTACFSPDGQKAYVHTGDFGKPIEIRQYDLTASDITLSKYTIAQDFYGSQFVISSLHLGPDDRIYVGMFLNSYIGVIENPDDPAQDIIFDIEGVDLLGGTFRKFGLQNDVVVPDPLPEDYEIFAWRDTILCDGTGIDLDLSALALDDIRWQDGSTDATYTIEQSGIYYVEAYLNNCLVTDTVEVSYNTDTPVGIFLPITWEGCTKSFTSPYKIIQWSTGSTDDTITITNSGSYWVEIEIGNCTIADTIIIDIQESSQYTDLIAWQDTVLCDGTAISLGLSDLSLEDIRWQDGSTDPIYTIDRSGTYHVEAYLNNCLVTDTVEVVYNTDNPEGLILPVTSDDCAPSFTSSYEIIQWSTGSTDDTITVSNSGTYWVEIEIGNCVITDTIIVDLPNSSYFTFDTILCSSQFLQLGGILIDSTGIFRDTLITSQGCDSIIEANITIQESVLDTIMISICEEGSFEIQGELVYMDGIYQDSLISQIGCDSIVLINLTVLPSIFGDSIYTTLVQGESIEIAGQEFDRPGLYELILESASGCDSIINIEITSEDTQVPTSDISISNIFSPNNDGIHDEWAISLPLESNDRIDGLWIYDRWGTAVYQITNMTDSRATWDGQDQTSKSGANVGNGVYVYAVRLQDPNGRSRWISGDVTVLR